MVTSSAPSKPTLEMQKYAWYFHRNSIIAASVGKNVYKMNESLSEDCVRTAKVTFDFFLSPSIRNKTKSILLVSSDKAAEDMMSNDTLIDPMEWFCKRLNEEFKQNTIDFHNFEELKKNISLPKPEKNYYYELPSGKTVREMMRNQEEKVYFDDKQYFKYWSVYSFYPWDDGYLFESMIPWLSVRLTIDTLTANEKLKTTVDEVFKLALEDYVEDFWAKYGVNHMQMREDMRYHSFSFILDEYFRKNVGVESEYKKIKTEIVDDLIRGAGIPLSV